MMTKVMATLAMMTKEMATLTKMLVMVDGNCQGVFIRGHGWAKPATILVPMSPVLVIFQPMLPSIIICNYFSAEEHCRWKYPSFSRLSFLRIESAFPNLLTTFPKFHHVPNSLLILEMSFVEHVRPLCRLGWPSHELGEQGEGNVRRLKGFSTVVSWGRERAPVGNFKSTSGHIQWEGGHGC